MSRATQPDRRLAAAAAGAVVGRCAYAALLRRPPGGPALWSRVNFRGEEVTLLTGPAATLGIAAGAGVAGMGTAACVAVGASAFGLLDDLNGTTHARGFRGHLRALRSGEVTSGLVKLAGIGLLGLGAAAALERRPFDTLITGTLIAGTANLVNLLDLRPGRALKATLLVAVPAAVAAPAAPVACAVAGTALALLPADLRERAMIGDTGANAAGAALGVALSAGASRRARLGWLTGVLALTAASEWVSFSAVIDRTPVLRAIDRLGRRVTPLA